ncbi:MAG TPA: arginine deiminase [Acholeplasmatales bacterium]|nr:arginine deiminase [Acholeplasmatales bacterium]
MKPLNVKSEIGKLKRVLLHRPGGELENLTPKVLDQLLFDDIPWLDLAIKEHNAFADLLKKRGVEVLYLSELAAEAIDTSLDVKDQFIKQFITEANVTSETLANVLTDYLRAFSSTKAMIEKTMAGIRKSEVPNFEKRTLSDYIKDYPFVTDPMPNLYFTRDPFSVIGNGVSISKMYTLTRSRETIYGEYIFKFHPRYGRNTIDKYYGRNYLPTIEGGDIMVLNDKLIAVGVSQRTHPAAIERLAKNLFYNFTTGFETILAFDIPKSRSFMHLDTALTQVDYGKFTIHHELRSTIKAFELTKDPNKHNKLLVRPLEKKLDALLEHYLQREVTLIPCGGEDVVSSDREQWNDGANTLCISPGEVIVYERNHITNSILAHHGIKVNTIPSSELSRGRGGPRCMSMPFVRENLK